MRTPRIVAALAIALIAVVVGGIASADSSTSVSCSYDPAVSTGCSAPQVPVTVTETTTATVTPAPVTSTVTETPAPVTVPGPTTTLLSTIVGPTTTVVGPTTTVTVTTSVPATTAATTTAATTTAATTAAAACAGVAGQEGGTDPFGTCWPGPANTGVPAGTTLTVVTGDQTYGTANTVVSGKDIRGCVHVTAAGVTIKNSKITCTSTAVLYEPGSKTGVRLTLQDVTVTCSNAQGTAFSGWMSNSVRVNISGCENGFDADSDVTVTDSYIHDLYQSGTAHTDGIQSAVGSNLLLDHNVWYSNNGTSAMIINNNPAGPHSANTTISRNLVAGGAYTIYCPRVSDTNYQVINNRFSRKFYSTVGAYGPVSDCTDEVWTGNVYADTGQPVPVG